MLSQWIPWADVKMKGKENRERLYGLRETSQNWSSVKVTHGRRGVSISQKFSQRAFQWAKQQTSWSESRPKEVSTPGIGKGYMPQYKRTSNPVCGCPQSPRSVGSALLSAPRCRRTASRFRYLISLTVMTVSFGTSNTFLNLVKDLNKGELVPQVAQHWAILPVLSGKYTSFTGNRSVNSDRTHCALSRRMEWEVVTDHPPIHQENSCYCRKWWDSSESLSFEAQSI